MKISLEGAIVGITGKVKGYSKQALGECVSKWGGYLESRSDPSPNTTLYFIGDNGSPRGKVDHARVYGATIVTGDALVKLLEEGEVEVDREEDKETFDELIGPIRALLAEPLTREAWMTLTEHVDACKADDMHKLLAYLQPQLDDRSAQYAQHPEVYLFETGELRPFPPAWLAQIMNGAVHEKFALCRTITCSEFYVGSKLASRVFDHHEPFAHITTFDSGDVFESHMKNKTFYKKMCTATNLQNVHTLVVEADKDNALGELLKATSLPHVTSLYLRPVMYKVRGPDMGEGIYFGPWSTQLVTVGASHVRHVEVLTERIEELPAIEHLALYTGDLGDSQSMAPMCTALPKIIPHIKRLSIRAVRLNNYSAGGYESYEGLGELLDAIAGQDLDVLDLRACRGTRLDGEVGQAFIDAHFIANGFVSHLGTLIVNEHVSHELCEVLRGHGVEVIAPTKVELEALAPTFEHIEDVPEGELERQADGQVHVHDAMMFDEPCEEAWQVLVGVVNGLEHQLDSEEFARDVKVLEAHLEQWPDGYRVLPAQWYKALFDEVYSPKLDLVRVLALRLDHGTSSDVKCTSRWLEHMSGAPHLPRIPKLDVRGTGGQKHQQKALLTLIQAMRPTVLSGWFGRERDDFFALLEAHGVLPEIEERFQSKDKHDTRFTSLDVYAHRHVSHEVTTPEELQQVFALEDLSHVVSLDLDLSHYNFAQDPDCSFLKAQPADFTSLKYVKIALRKHDEHVYRELVTWLQRARPIVIHDTFVHGDNASPVVPLIQAGVYGRAFGSVVTLPERMTSEELAGCMSTEDFHVPHIRFNAYRGYSLDGVSALVACMHEGLRECVRELYWPTELSEWPDVGGACARLPNLSTLAVVESAFMTVAARAPFLEAFEAMTHLHGLPMVKLLGPLMSDPQGFGAKEIKPLQKLEGSPANVLCLGRFMNWEDSER